MVKFKTPLILIICGVISGCIQSEPKPTLTPAQLQTALFESETRIDEKWRNYCAGIIDNQKKQQASLNEVRSSQGAASRQLLTINDKLDKQPEPVVMMTTTPESPQKCPTVAPPSVDDKIILGRTEWLWLEAVNRVFRARVDSGATTSSLSAHHIVEFERDGKKWIRFNMVPDDDVDDSYEVEAPLVRFARIRQASSEDIDRRPVVALTIKIGEFTDTAEFTLTDRSSMTYPILLGREFLRDIALIDVAKSYHQPKPEPLKNRPSLEPDVDEDSEN
ncbi:MAG: ATP-dependent zinc protease [Methylophaga sp.]